MWMGVPSLYLDPPDAMRHGGRNIYRKLGLESWVLRSEDDYVAAALGWVRRPDELSDLRKGARARLLGSPFDDPVPVARRIEAIYRQLWIDWCRGRFPYLRGPRALRHSGPAEGPPGLAPAGPDR